MTAKLPLLKRLSTQILISILALMILIICILAFSLYSIAYGIIVNNTTDHAYKIAESLVQTIDPQAFAEIRTMEDEATDAYQTIRANLNNVREITGCRFIYTMRKEDDGTFSYVVDGSALEEISHVGDVEESLPGYERAWAGQSFKETELVDQGDWGILASAYFPIKSANGSVVGFIGVDYDAADIYAGLQRLQMIAILISLGSIVVCIAVGLVLTRFITKPINQTADLAYALSEGDLDWPVTIKSSNEIGQLAGVLDKDMRQAFQKIQQAQVVSEKQADYQMKQVESLVINLGRLAQGNLMLDMKVTPPDEYTLELHDIYSQIANQLQSAVETIKRYIGEMTQVLGTVAKGDLTTKIDSDFLGDFSTLKHSINQIVTNISSILTEVSSAAEQVTTGTQHVTEGSQAISRGANEQASAVQELTASITEVANKTARNASDANQARTLTNQVKTDALDGNERMKAMQQAMLEINQASEGINKIIKVIDDIAFQTNILALNAAVEAARAGVHGKGFAVVANEVGSLATKSSDAARETTALIKDSVAKTHSGTIIANETALALSNIIQGIQKAETLIGNIAISSSEQSAAITQINKGIEQVALVVHSNSATTEQTAATSQELSSHTALLRTMVGRFNLK